MSIDYPRAWQIASESSVPEHHVNCSYLKTAGGLLCDCKVITEHKEFKSKIFYGKNGIEIKKKRGSDNMNKVYNLYKRNRLKGRLFKNIHTNKLYIVRFVRAGHIYYAGDGFKSKMVASSFANCFIKVA